MLDVQVIATATTPAHRSASFDVTEHLAAMPDKEVINLARNGWRQDQRDDRLCKAGSAAGVPVEEGSVSIPPNAGLAYVERQRPGLLAKVLKAMNA